MLLVTAASACGGHDQPGDGSFGPGSMGSSSSTDGPCDDGGVRTCSVTVEQSNGIISCFRGTQTCDEGVWGSCADGVMTVEADPTFGPDAEARWKALSISMPAACISNPCDPSCMFFDEDPTDLTPSGGGTPTIPDWSTADTTASCAHDLCDVNADNLDPSCHGCVQAVCDVDPSCCTDSGSTNEWDEGCVKLVYSECLNVTEPNVFSLCDFAAFGKDNVTFSNGGTGQPVVASAGDVNLSTDCRVGNVYSKGNISLSNSCQVSGDVIGEGTFSISASSSSWVTGDVQVAGSAALQNGSHVGGDLQSSVGLNLGGTAYVTGNVWTGDNGIVMNGSGKIGGTASTTGNMTGQNTDQITGLATVNSGKSIDSNIQTLAGRDLDGPVSVPDAPVVTLPDLSAYRRDLSASCAIAAAQPAIYASSNISLPPGTYGYVFIPANYSLTLSSGGTYVFDELVVENGTVTDMYLAGSAPWDVNFCKKFTLGNDRQIYLDGTSTYNNPEDLMLYSAATTGDGVNLGVASGFNAMVLVPDAAITVSNGYTGTSAFWGKTINAGTSFTLNNIDSAVCESVDLIGDAYCNGLPFYAPSHDYNLGDQVSYNGTMYECIEATYCDLAAYSPGLAAGAAAWSSLGSCPITNLPPSTNSCPLTLDILGMPEARTPCYSGVQCQINSHCTEVITDPSCEHSKCSSGVALARGCDSCVDMICDTKPSCCTAAWDSSCVALVESACDASCGAVTVPGCEHDLCVTGPAITKECSSDAANVCNTPGFEYCCTDTPGSWDQACVDELYQNIVGTTPPGPGESICEFAIIGSGTASLYSTTIKGSLGWLQDPIGMVAGSVYMAEEFGGAGDPQVTGDVYIQGAFTMATGSVGGDLTYSGTYSVPSVGGTATYKSPLPGPTPPVLTFSCADTTSTSITSNVDYAAGSYGNITVKAGNTLTLSEANTYTFQSLTIENGATLKLPASGNVNIQICGNFKMGKAWGASNAAKVVSPSNNPLQALFYVKTGSVVLDEYADIYGVVMAETGTISLTYNVQVHGMVHAYRSTITCYKGTVIDGTGADGNACIERGLDPTAVACPITTPLSDEVAEGGSCVENGNPPTHTESWCSTEADLSVDMSCNTDTIPVCNHGGVTVPAGEAELIFYPRSAAQFAHAEPQDYWEKGRCTVTSAIAPGTCVDQVCDSMLLNEDMTVRAALKSGASVTECSTLDNWSYFIDIPGCMSGGTATYNYEYEAVCDSDKYPTWGLLTWEATTPGASTVSFEARTASTSSALASASFVTVGTAQLSPEDTQSCVVDDDPLTTCPIDLTDQIYSTNTSAVQGRFMELQITLASDGSNVPTLADWRVTYSCIEDQ